MKLGEPRSPNLWDQNRDRLLNGDIARKFMISVLNLPESRPAPLE
jgi:hypothetical protein